MKRYKKLKCKQCVNIAKIEILKLYARGKFIIFRQNYIKISKNCKKVIDK